MPELTVRKMKKLGLVVKDPWFSSTTLEGKTLTVTVSKQALESAVRSDSMHCWIAETLKEYPGVSIPIVDRQLIVFSHAPSGKRYTYFTPPIVIDAIIAFDEGRVEELPDGFTFKLRNPRQIRARRVGQGYKLEPATVVEGSTKKGKGGHKITILGGKGPRKTASMMRKYGSRHYEG